MALIGAMTYLVESDPVRKFLFFILALINYAVFFVAIYGFYVRTQHSGKVCSGDFIESGESQDGYLIQQGRFMKYSIICVFSLVFLAVSLVLCAIIRAPRRIRHDEETQLERL